MILTVEILNNTDGGGSYSSQSINDSELSVGGQTNVGSGSSFNFTLTDDSSAEITLQTAGFRAYSMIVNNVYAENKTIQLLLVPIVTDNTSNEYNKPYPYFFYFLNPCSYAIEYYSASSFPGQHRWYVNNELISTGNSTGIFNGCQAGDLQLKARGTTYDVIGCVQTVIFNRTWANAIGEGDDTPSEGQDVDTILAEDTTNNITVVEYQPTYSFSIEQTEGYIADCDCYLDENTYRIVPSITLPNANNYNITYTFIGIEIGDIDTQTYAITGPVEDYDYEFQLTGLGDYKVDIVIEDVECGLEYNDSIVVTACDFISLSYADCGIYEFKNLSYATPVTYTVSDMNDNTSDVMNLAAGSSVNLQFTDIGSFTLAITEGGETTYRVIHNYCSLEKCFSDYILDILCGNTLDCSCDYDSSSEIKTIRMWALYNTYFMKLQNEFTFNTYYTALSQTKLDELSELNEIADKIKTICDRENCVSNTCTDVDSEFVTITDNVITIGFSTTTTNDDCGCS